MKAETAAREASPRGSRRRLRTRTALMSAGQHLFALRPFEGITIDNIVEVADVAKGSFYNHFVDKDALASAIYEQLSGELELRIQENNVDAIDPVERIARGACTVMRYSSDYPDRMGSLLALFARRGGASDPRNAGLVAEIRKGIDGGRLSCVDETTGMLVIYGLSRVTIRHAALSRPADLAALAEAMVAAMLRALGVDQNNSATIARSAVGRVFQGAGS